MFVIDLKMPGFENHEAVARFLGDNLTPSAKEHRRTWVIHLFCPNRSWPQNLGPVSIVILMLFIISAKLTCKTNTESHQWDPFKVEHKSTTATSRKDAYQKTMEILKALISRILEKLEIPCISYSAV